ncbi:hypothetical protein [Micromonospora sp. NPDC002717]|uniref:hypothetical protein n=1 Tax=Micromonospora sp. NPDC002717 TaxID=3154424 RepID=UPI00331C4396
MLLNRVRTTVDADHSQYLVADHDADISREFTTGGTGLIGPRGDTALVCTGTAYGPVRLTVEAHDVPPALDPESWDEVVDVSFELPSARLTIRTLMAGPAATFDIASGSGAYWLRLQARGRDDARNDPKGENDEPIEEHLILVWPADRIPDVPHAVVHKATDRVGAYHRHEETRRGGWTSSTVEFRTSPALWSIPDWVRWPDEPGVQVPVDQAVLRSARLDLTVTAVTVYRTGCLILLNVHARRSDLDLPGWKRFSDVAQHGFGFPGHSVRRPLHPDALRLSIAWPGQPPVISAKARDTDSQQPDGPTLVGYWHGATVMRDYVVADHRAWLWPRPPGHSLQLTMEWPALGVSPTTVTLDGARIAAAHRPGAAY